MRVVFIAPLVQPITPKLRYGGVERLVQLLAEEVTRHCNVTVLAAEGSCFPKPIQLIPVKPAGERDFEERALVPAALPLLQRDGIVFHDFSHSLRISAVGKDVPSIAHIWFDPYMMQPLRPKHNIAAVSHWQAERFMEKYQGQRAEVIDPICGDNKFYFPHSNHVAAPPRFVSLGNYHPNKGHLEALRLCNRFGAALDIAGANGDGYPKFYEVAIRAELRNKSRSHGEVTEKKKRRLLAWATAMLYAINYPPGTGEAHAMKLIDGMLMGTPAVAYRVGALAEVIDEGVTGLLAGDQDEFVQRMAEVPKLSRLDCYLQASERWAIPKVVERLLPWYEKVAGGLRW